MYVLIFILRHMKDHWKTDENGRVLNLAPTVRLYILYASISDIDVGSLCPCIVPFLLSYTVHVHWAMDNVLYECQ